jgi:hypothetical protein
MSDILHSLKEFLARLLGMDTETERKLAELRRKETEFEKSIRDSHESLEGLKQEIRTLELRAVQARKELDKTPGDSKRIVISQIEQVFRDIKLREGQECVILGKIDRNQVALAKLREIMASVQHGGATEDVLEDLSLDVSEAHSEMKQADKAAASLEKERYTRPEPVAEPETESIEDRTAKVEAERKVPSLSPEIERRLKQLATEE